jgi:hypothetical protein
MPVGLDEMYGIRKVLARNFREPLGDGRMLKRLVFDRVSRPKSEPRHPKSTEAAVAVEHHDWLTRKGRDLLQFVHASVVAEMLFSTPQR